MEDIRKAWAEKKKEVAEGVVSYIPARPETINLKELEEWLDIRARPGLASNREYFADKGYDIEKVIGFFLGYKERRRGLTLDNQPN